MTNNTNYSIDYYSFKTGNYIYTDCDNTTLINGKLLVLHLWTSTIRAQNHMNGADVINTLSIGNGSWVQGRQCERLTNSKKETESKEVQYYISSNKENAVGYVRNRAYNMYTKRINDDCDFVISNPEPYLYFDTPINNLMNIAWSDGLPWKLLKIQKLKKNTNYQVDWYSYKEGWYLGTDCINTSILEGTLILRYPKLFATLNQVERPMVWFVVRQNDCMNGMMPLEQNIEAFLLEENYQSINFEDEESSPSETYNSIIYPNPFEDYITVESYIKDEIIIQSVTGKIVLQQSVDEGSSKINTKDLLGGLYIVNFINQGIQIKLIKK